MNAHDNLNIVHEAIVDLYMTIKIRNSEEVNKTSNLQIEGFNHEKQTLEKEKLTKSSSLKLIDYIKSSIEILVNIKVEEQIELNKIKFSQENNILSTNEEENTNEYEKLLRQLESEIRNHIKVKNLSLNQIEHQMRLHDESLQDKIDELEKIYETVSGKYKNLKKVNFLK